MNIKPIRIAVVDDSRFMRTLITETLSTLPEVEIVATAGTAAEAREVIRTHAPDVITLDVELPDMNGIALLERIMALRPTATVMVSAFTAAGTDATLAALELGAVDVVAKPDGSFGLMGFRAKLREKVLAAAAAHVGYQPVPRAHATHYGSTTGTRPELIGIASSTGGVAALSRILEGLAEDTPPIVISQHMPANFVLRFAERMQTRCRPDVAVATDGEQLDVGMIRLAPGDLHVVPKMRPHGLVSTLSNAPPPCGHRPSGDVMFDAMAELDMVRCGVILTGMGRDGANGLLALRRSGGLCIAQDEASAVVFGMPRVACEINAVDEVLSLDAIAARLSTFSQPSGRKVRISN
ncbi:chemotaxis-specific protein-glutamate methyltransferase CheB [Pontivivens ytuae]|uniref:Protein-glutamate methylesterase/protein-glutamine glutaminase n=1 Tax=Pontivivens ytuae TaxID=2789856 RepID=A0A7S9LNP8_9RHOB|nr:chemotaxis-specific protein-glutamate methyltransferase CheB [Pontivivens ytuae]QPH52389.1 chemotaxis-specific protein-glutamate methyltransferase CheB [Pontivivens ytuae]